jgi:plastocyanin
MKTLFAVALVVAGLVPAGVAHATPEVAMTGVRFVPHEVTVKVGEGVTWVHRDSGLGHHVVADDGSFDSNPTCGRPGPAGHGACMEGGDRYTHLFTEPGVVGYYCRLHGSPGGKGMAGTVRVEG